MTIQIFGTKKCNDTKKAERFFKERGVKYHFVDLAQKGISPGELENISRAVALEDLLDTQSKVYKKRNLQYMVFDVRDILLEEPLLFKTPVVRNGKAVTVGNAPGTWEAWLREMR